MTVPKKKARLFSPSANSTFANPAGTPEMLRTVVNTLRPSAANFTHHWRTTALRWAPLKTPSSNQMPLIRNFHNTLISRHGHVHKPKPGEELHVTFITKEGEQLTYEVAEGDSILDIAQHYNLDMEGACGGSCACSTCHVIVDPEFYDEIPEPDDDENDMLDLAFGLTETSRLGCCIHMSKEIDGLRVALPAMTRNLNHSDFS